MEISPEAEERIAKQMHNVQQAYPNMQIHAPIHVCGGCGQEQTLEHGEYKLIEYPRPIKAQRPTVQNAVSVLEQLAPLVVIAEAFKTPIGSPLPACVADMSESGRAMAKEFEECFRMPSESTPAEWTDFQACVLKTFAVIERYLVGEPARKTQQPSAN